MPMLLYTYLSNFFICIQIAFPPCIIYINIIHIILRSTLVNHKYVFVSATKKSNSDIDIGYRVKLIIKLKLTKAGPIVTASSHTNLLI